MNSISGTILCCIVLLFFGCKRSSEGENKTSLSKDSSEAYEQVKKHFPKGISESEAVKILADLGAEVSKLEKDTYANHMLVGTLSEENAK